jgi:hypothetical protein
VIGPSIGPLSRRPAMSRQQPAPPFEASMLATHLMPIGVLQPVSVPRSSRSWSPPPHCSSEHVSTLPRRSSRSPPPPRSQPYGVRAVETATLDVAGDYTLTGVLSVRTGLPCITLLHVIQFSGTQQMHVLCAHSKTSSAWRTRKRSGTTTPWQR